MKEEPNILFIIIDALRANNVGCYGYSKQTTPNIDKIAQEGLLFENAFSCATTTYPSLTSIFSGKHPASHGITKMEPGGLSRHQIQRFVDGETLFLPEILQMRGYKTIAVDWLGRWLKRGYDHYTSVIDPRRLALVSSFRKLLVEPSKNTIMLKFHKLLQKYFLQHRKNDALAVTNKSIELINKVHNEKFFLFVHYWDSHAPYDPPKKYLEKFIDKDYGDHREIEQVLALFEPEYAWFIRKRLTGDMMTVNDVLMRYDASIAYVDYELGRLLGSLEDHGILDDTLVVITSDHGESLTEHDIYFCHHGLYDATIHVPLIFRYPDFPRNRRIGDLVQHIDVTPTLLEVIGAEDSLPYIDGKIMTPLLNSETDQFREAIFVEEADAQMKRSIRTKKFKFISAASEEDALCRECGKIHGGIKELYDLDKDPGEIHNIVNERPIEAKNLDGELARYIQSLNKKREMKNLQKDMRDDLDSSPEEERLIQKRLKELGYI